MLICRPPDNNKRPPVADDESVGKAVQNDEEEIVFQELVLEGRGGRGGATTKGGSSTRGGSGAVVEVLVDLEGGRGGTRAGDVSSSSGGDTLEGGQRVRQLDDLMGYQIGVHHDSLDASASTSHSSLFGQVPRHPRSGSTRATAVASVSPVESATSTPLAPSTTQAVDGPPVTQLTPTPTPLPTEHTQAVQRASLPNHCHSQSSLLLLLLLPESTPPQLPCRPRVQC